MQRLLIALILSTCVIASVGRLSNGDDDETIDLLRHYGFLPLEIFKLEQRSNSMLPGDFNGDGRLDLVLIDNSHSRLDLLIQRDGAREDDDTDGLQVNEIGSHWRFDHQKLPIDRSAQALAVGDFNSDKRSDLAYFDDTDRLTILYQPEDGDDWDDRKVIRLADVDAQPWRLAAGDVNKDGRDDLVVLGEKLTYVLHQTVEGRFGRPEQIRNTAESLGLALIADLDGDDRNDLFYMATEGNDRKASARLQTDAGQLGPEIRFDLEDTRGMILSDVYEGAGAEILSIDGTTGRVQVSQFSRERDEDDGLNVRLVQYGFGDAASAKGRDLATGDLDGDGLIDVVVTDPAAAQVIVFHQDKTNGLDAGTASPSFLGVEQVRILTSGEDGAAEVFVLSSQEETIGVSTLEGGRLSFPTSLPVPGEPATFELLDRDGDGQIEVVVLVKIRRGKYELHQLTRTGGEWTSSEDPLLEFDVSDPERCRHWMPIKMGGSTCC